MLSSSSAASASRRSRAGSESTRYSSHRDEEGSSTSTTEGIYNFIRMNASRCAGPAKGRATPAGTVCHFAPIATTGPRGVVSRLLVGVDKTATPRARLDSCSSFAIMRAIPLTSMLFVLFSCGGESRTSPSDAGDTDSAVQQDAPHESSGSSALGGSSGGSSGSSSGGMSTSSSGTTPDSGGPDGSSGSPIQCGGNGSGGTMPTDGGCTTMMLFDNCSVTCSCPDGTCQCQGGGSTRTVPFTGCPSCPSDPKALCNFQ